MTRCLDALLTLHDWLSCHGSRLGFEQIVLAPAQQVASASASERLLVQQASWQWRCRVVLQKSAPHSGRLKCGTASLRSIGRRSPRCDTDRRREAGREV